MKIRKKILLGFTAVILVFLIAGVVTSLGISEMTKQTRSVQDEFNVNQQATTYANGVTQLQIGSLLYAQGSKEMGRQFIEVGKQYMEEGRTQLKGNLTEAALLAELDEMGELEVKMIATQEEIVTISDGNSSNKAALLNQQIQTLEARTEALNLRLSNFIDTALGSDNKVSTSLETAEAVGNATVTMSAIAIIVALVCSLAIALYLSGQLVGPIVFLTKAAEKVSKGELDQKIEIDSDDEIQDLGESFQRMINAFKIMQAMEQECQEDK